MKYNFGKFSYYIREWGIHHKEYILVSLPIKELIKLHSYMEIAHSNLIYSIYALNHCDHTRSGYLLY